MIPATAWVDRAVYPFTSRYFTHDAGRLHYVDEGAGAPVLMLHGNPTWSFLYRHLIQHLAPAYRCLAPDYLGFGLSDKPPGWSYGPAAQAQAVEALVEALGLRRLTLVLHDWGGPLGLSYAVRHPERIRRLVLMNTWMWPVDHVLRFRLFSKAMGGPVGRFLTCRLNAFAGAVMPLACRGRLTRTAHRHYLRPLRRPESREGSWVLARALVGATPWLRHLWAQRRRLAGTPALILWGMKDPAFREPELRRWRGLFPEARVQRLAAVGHYVPEELGAGLGPLVADFLEATA